MDRKKRFLSLMLAMAVVICAMSMTVSAKTTKKSSKAAKAKTTYIVGIDAGHQLKGNSATEPNGPGSGVMKAKVAGGTRGVTTGKPEYQLTIEIAKRLKTELRSRGYKVVMTRTKNDVDISNIERAQKLNETCDIAIRLHADGGASSAHGASVLYPSTSNPYVGHLSEASKNLSQCVVDSYCEATDISNRGLSIRDDLTGTNWSTIPVTLLEMGFMTNSFDDAYMSTEKGHANMVEGIANGIDRYFGK